VAPLDEISDNFYKAVVKAFFSNVTPSIGDNLSKSAEDGDNFRSAGGRSFEAI
jgi:hypothetical protein